MANEKLVNIVVSQQPPALFNLYKKTIDFNFLLFHLLSTFSSYNTVRKYSLYFNDLHQILVANSLLILLFQYSCAHPAGFPVNRGGKSKSCQVNPVLSSRFYFKAQSRSLLTSGLIHRWHVSMVVPVNIKNSCPTRLYFPSIHL